MRLVPVPLPPVPNFGKSMFDRQLAAIRSETAERMIMIFFIASLTSIAVWLAQTNRWPPMAGTTAFAVLLAAELYVRRPRHLPPFVVPPTSPPLPIPHRPQSGSEAQGDNRG